jgi:hypothetical protein
MVFVGTQTVVASVDGCDDPTEAKRCPVVRSRVVQLDQQRVDREGNLSFSG